MNTRFFSSNDRDEAETLMASDYKDPPAVVEIPTYCIQGNCIDRADTAGCNGRGWAEEVGYTLNTIDRPAVCAPVLIENHPNDSRVKISEDGCSQTLSGRMGTGGGNTPMVLCVGNGQTNNVAMSEVSNTLDTMHDQQALLECGSVVRRITPLEAERLQGMPDGYTDIGEWTDSKGKKRKTTDANRYKAMGDGWATPFWLWLFERISARCEEKTMGSLFDGIGTAPLLWQSINGDGTCRWSSEIEDYKVAVCKKHFGDEETGEKGNWEQYRPLYRRVDDGQFSDDES